MILPHKKTEIDHFIQKGWREGRLMNRRKLMNVLVCLQIFLLCGGAVSAGHAETVVNIENKTIDAILVTVICMECPSFGWGGRNSLLGYRKQRNEERACQYQRSI